MGRLQPVFRPLAHARKYQEPPVAGAPAPQGKSLEHEHRTSPPEDRGGRSLTPHGSKAARGVEG